MSVFVRRCIGKDWKTIEVTDVEVAAVEKTNFQANVKIAQNVAQYLPTLLKKGLPAHFNLSEDVVKALIPVFVEKMATPLHFSIENYVDATLAKDTVNSL